MNLYLEIGEVIKTNDDSLVECVNKKGLCCAHCVFYDKPAVCSALACSDGVRPDGKDVLFLKLYGAKGGEK